MSPPVYALTPVSSIERCTGTTLRPEAVAVRDALIARGLEPRHAHPRRHHPCHRR